MENNESKVVVEVVRKEGDRLKVFCGQTSEREGRLVATVYGKISEERFDEAVGEWHVTMEDANGHYLGSLWVDEVKDAGGVSSVRH